MPSVTAFRVSRCPSRTKDATASSVTSTLHVSSPPPTSPFVCTGVWSGPWLTNPRSNWSESLEPVCKLGTVCGCANSGNQVSFIFNHRQAAGQTLPGSTSALQHSRDQRRPFRGGDISAEERGGSRGPRRRTLSSERGDVKASRVDHRRTDRDTPLLGGWAAAWPIVATTPSSPWVKARWRNVSTSDSSS